MLAPAGRGYLRKDLNIREGVKPRYEYGEYERGRWQPATPTIVLVGEVAIGITIYETIEEVDSVWRGGKPVRYTAPPPLRTPKRGRALVLPQEHISKHWFPTGRLGVHAYAADHVEWEQTWIEKTPGELTSMFDAIAKTFEGAVAKVTKLLEEKRIEKDRREKEYELQRQRWRREEDARRRKEEEAARVKRIQDDVAVWRLARDIGAFAAEAKQMVTDANCQITKGGPLEDWLDWATAYAETVDPLAQLRADLRRVIAEREAKAAAKSAASDPAAASTAAASGSSPSTSK